MNKTGPPPLFFSKTMNKSFPLIINFFIYFIFFLIIIIFLININNHPITIIIIILIYRTIICLNISLWKSNFILSIFLFLIIIRGLLIIFLYFSSLISNVQFKLKPKVSLIIFFFINIIFLFYYITHNKNSPTIIIYKYKFHENSPIISSNKFSFNNILNLYEYPISNLTIISILYLLLSLFTIIKICSSKSLSLRKIN